MRYLSRNLRGKVSSQGGDADAFIFTVDTTKSDAGTTPSNTFALGAGAGLVEPYNAEVDWGDGNSDTITAHTDPALTHVYSTGGVYTISIRGVFPYIRAFASGDEIKWETIEQWGDIGIEKAGSSFNYCYDLKWNATDAVVLPPDSSGMFARCSDLHLGTGNWDLFDTSNVTTFTWFLQFCYNFNFSVSSFDTSNVTTMNQMFDSVSLKQSVGHFDLSSCTAMSLFYTGLTDEPGETTNLDDIYIQWAAQVAANPGISALNPSFGSNKYSSAASAARQALIDAGWTITDGGLV
jgi:hypothetical protein